MSLKKNLDELVFGEMKSRIIKGDWAQGVVLDIESLVADYGVSRTPVLQALKRMQNEGMLTVSRGGKFMFPTYNEEQVISICRTRLVLELEALDEIAQREQQADWSALRDLTRWCQRRTVTNQIIDARAFDMDWHKALVAFSRNECLIGIYPQVQGQFMVANYLQADHSTAQQKVAADDHVLFMDALDAGDFAQARAVLTQHIENAGEKILRRMRSRKETETPE